MCLCASLEAADNFRELCCKGCVTRGKLSVVKLLFLTVIKQHGGYAKFCSN
jgi:hypothetical protein